MENRKIEAVLFDLDDTLIDHSGAMDGAVKEIFQAHAELKSHYGDAEHLAEAWRAAHSRYYPLYLAGKLSHDEQRIPRIRSVWEKAGVPLSDPQCLVLSDRFLSFYEACWALYPEVQATLDALSAYRLGVVTNGWGPQQRRKLKNCGIERFVQAILISGEAGTAKPEKEIFHLACKDLDVLPENAVFVGDLFDLDIVGAANAGLAPVWLQRTSVPAADSKISFKLIQSLAELPPWLNGEI